MKNIFPVLNLLAFCLALTTMGCMAQPEHQISGHITMHPNWKPFVYLLQPRNFREIASDYLGQVIDSAAIADDGTFAFRSVPDPEQSKLLELAMQKTTSRFANHLIDTLPAESNYMPFVLTKGNPVQIKADASFFQKTIVFILPSNENRVLISLRDTRSAAFEKLSAALPAYEEDSLLLEKEKIYLRYDRSMMDFADTTTCMEAAMVAIRWISPTGDYERMPEFIYGQCQKWATLHPEDPFTKDLCRLAEKDKLSPMTGDMMPDFPLPMVTGDTLFLIFLAWKKTDPGGHLGFLVRTLQKRKP